MVSPPIDQRNMVQPSNIVPSNPDNLRSFQEQNSRNSYLNLNRTRQNDFVIPNHPIDLNLVIYTASDVGNVEQIWRFQERVVLPSTGPLPIYLT
jgi:hypothetical protein